MATELVRIGSTQLILDLVNKADTGAPLGWINSLVKDVERTVPADELASVKVHGLENVYFTHEHTLSPTEELQKQLAVFRSKEAQLKALFRPDGSTVPDFATLLKKILG